MSEKKKAEQYLRKSVPITEDNPIGDLMLSGDSVIEAMIGFHKDSSPPLPPIGGKDELNRILPKYDYVANDVEYWSKESIFKVLESFAQAPISEEEIERIIKKYGYHDDLHNKPHKERILEYRKDFEVDLKALNSAPTITGIGVDEI